jgi:hypothetical protein
MVKFYHRAKSVIGFWRDNFSRLILLILVELLHRRPNHLLKSPLYTHPEASQIATDPDGASFVN